MIRCLNQQYRSGLHFMATGLRDQLHITASAFMILILLGFAYGTLFPQQTDAYIIHMTQQIQNSGIVSEDGALDVVDLFLQNAQALSMTLLYGFLPFLHLPALPLGINATLLGLMAAYYINNGISLVVYLAAIVPHGIVELPVMILCFSLALYLCRYNKGQMRATPDQAKQFSRVIKEVFRVHLLFVIPLLSLSAIAECYITPVVMGLFI